MTETEKQNLSQLKTNFKKSFFVPLTMLIFSFAIFLFDTPGKAWILLLITAFISTAMALSTQKHLSNAFAIEDAKERYTDVVKTYTVFSSFHDMSIAFAFAAFIFSYESVIGNMITLTIFFFQILTLFLLSKSHSPEQYFEEYKATCTHLKTPNL